MIKGILHILVGVFLIATPGWSGGQQHPVNPSRVLAERPSVFITFEEYSRRKLGCLKDEVELVLLRLHNNLSIPIGVDGRLYRDEKNLIPLILSDGTSVV